MLCVCHFPRFGKKVEIDESRLNISSVSDETRQIAARSLACSLACLRRESSGRPRNIRRVITLQRCGATCNIIAIKAAADKSEAYPVLSHRARGQQLMRNGRVYECNVA